MTTLAVADTPADSIPEEIATARVVGSAPVRGWLVLAGVMVVSAAYTWWHLHRGWIPHDEGALAQAAERVLQGELPHRDFIDIYSGGLAMVNAAAFRLLGTSLGTMRVVLFVAFLAWVPAVYYAASRFVAPLAAAAVTLLAVVWTLPTYPEPVPSWYNLFLATAGAAALLRHLERDDTRWLVAAGAAGGLSCLFKIVGLYYLAGALLFLVFLAHLRSDSAGDRPQRARVYAAFVSAMLALFVAALVLLVRRQAHPSEIAQFVLPGSVLAGFVAWNEWTHAAGGDRARFSSLARVVAPFLAGATLPVAVFVVPYVRSGALGALVNGIFVLPAMRFAFATSPAMPVIWMLALVPVAALLAVAVRTGGRLRRLEAVLLAVTLPVLLVMTGREAWPYRLVWLTAFSTTPLLVVAGVVVLARRRAADDRDPLLRQRTMLLLCITALCALVQFPYSVPIYLCYVAPLVALSALALSRYIPHRASRIPAALLVFFLMFAVLRTNTSEMITFGNAFRPYTDVISLPMARGGIVVQGDDARVYGPLVAELRAHARGGYTWASPDAPEVYFLSGLRNPTRSLFEFFEASPTGDARVLRALDTHGITAVVLNARPAFSAPITREMFVALATRYPHAHNIGGFQLRWRE